MKRVVTGVNSEGRSCVMSVEELEKPDFFFDIWNYEPKDAAGFIASIEPDAAAAWLEPPSGGVKWMYIVFPPWENEEIPDMDGIDEEGYHATRTVDFDYILDGEITLVLDEESVVIGPGDFVVLQASNHAWRNETDKPTTMLAILHTPV